MVDALREKNMELYYASLAPWRLLLKPVFSGLDRIPDERPLLFVGNHTLYGLLDVPFMYSELYSRKGIFLRGLGDHLHFKVPIWKNLIELFGGIDGNPENCSRLMGRGECLLVFPGGSREVAKRRGEKYKLIWKKRIGFARLAIKHGCTIQPFSAVGIEDMFKLVFDANDYKKTPLKHIQEALKIRDDILHPICKGAGPFGLPRLERLYFSMGNPIETRSYNGDFSVENCWDLRKKTMSEIEQGIDYLQRLQMNDPHRDFFSRMAGYFYK